MEVYLDLLMVLNFAVDLLLLVGTNRLAGHPLGVRRAMPAAVLGGIYGGVCLVPGFAFLGNTLWRLVCLGLMGVLAFGANQNGLRRMVLFVFLSMALGGIAVGLHQGGFVSLVLSAGGVCFLCLVGFRGKATGQQYVPVSIDHKGTRLNLTALVDTGNTLRDPVTGMEVLVVEDGVAWQLLGLTPEQVAHPIEAMANVPGLRLIPYRAVGQRAGLLLGMRPEKLEMNGKERACVIAFAPQNLGQGQYQALVGGML